MEKRLAFLEWADNLPRMWRWIVLLCVCGMTPGKAAEPAEGAMRWKAFQVHHGGRSRGEDLQAPPTVDSRDFLKGSGIEIPPGGEAFFDKHDGTLFVRAPESVLESVEVLLKDAAEFAPLRQVRVEATVALFEFNSDIRLDILTYEQAREAAGSSWRVLDRVSTVGHMGHRSTASVVRPERLLPTRTNAVPDAEEDFPGDPRRGLANGDAGLWLQIEPAYLDRHNSCSIAIELQYAGIGAIGKDPVMLTSSSDLLLGHDIPVLAKAITLPHGSPSPSSAKLRMLGIILRATVIDGAGLPAPAVGNPVK